ncbi:hypothetical protein FOL46_003182 [Perkinsus olseni]|uniref:Phytase-like domain-containing protein n=1 Tax=Perkinsus olseni TaxID=32597 RepID=A0A7J6MU10_PEROL|nr:hypothetical protein FOL46_003182 [Perkinsus olseni]
MFPSSALMVALLCIPAAGQSTVVHLNQWRLPLRNGSSEDTITSKGTLKHMQTLRLQDIATNGSRFGGLSSIIVAPNGSGLLAISDRGAFEDMSLGSLTVDGEYNVTEGNIIPFGTGQGDAEGLTINGYYEGGGGGPTAGVDGLLLMLCEEPSNSSVPTTDPQGRIVLPGWAYNETSSNDLFHPTDMAELNGGDMMILFRRFVPTEGNGMRIGYVTKGELDQAMAVGGTLNPQIIAEVRTRDGYIIDNEEALAIREDPTTGRTFVYTLSDNNYNEVRQKTLLSTYEWVAAAGTATPPPTTTAVPSLATSPTSYSLILFLTYIVPSTYY